MESRKIDKILLPVPVEQAQKQEDKVRSEFWPKLKRVAAKIPFAEDAVAAFYCATDSSTPLKVRGTLFAALAYFILPLDFVPDLLALVGFGDDMAVMTAAIALVANHITDEHRAKARTTLEELEEDSEAV